MSNAIWKGHITFSMVSIPIALYSAEKRTELHFHLLDSRDQARVRYERINDETGKEVPWDKVVKAFEFDKNNYVVLNKEDFKRAAPKEFKTIDIESFIYGDEINPIYFERPYYLIPEKGGEKGYVLLRETLKKIKKIAIAKVVIRDKQYLAALIPMDNALVLNLLRFKQELLDIENFNFPGQDLKDYAVNPNELKMAEQLVDSMTEKWHPNKYHDDYREKLLQWIEEKASHQKVKKPKEKEEVVAAKTIDFMAALKKSLESVGKTTAKNEVHPQKVHRKAK